MIDWITATVKCDHAAPINDGFIQSITGTGEILFNTPKRKMVEGSYSDKISIRSSDPWELTISGNPSKFLQGHNIFGSDDLNALFNLMFDKLLEVPELALKPTPEQIEAVRRGEYTITRVDLNQSFDLGGTDQVLAFLRHAGTCGSLTKHKKGQFNGETVYFGQRSRHWSCKMYSKGLEIKKRDRKPSIDCDELFTYANKALRIEVTLRSRVLKEINHHRGTTWTKENALKLFFAYMSSFEMPDNATLPTQTMLELPTHLRSSYALWESGHDPRAVLSKPTFYRHRKELLKFNIDIAAAPPEKEESNVVPFVRFIEMKPMGIPYWAIKEGLVACS